MTDFTSLEKLLSQTVPLPSEEYASNLRNVTLRAYDLHHQTERSKRFLFHRRQILGWVSALGLALFAFMAFTSNGRALAQQILQFGLFIFTDGPTKAEQYLTATPEADSIPSVVQAELSGASETAGFPVYYPTYLPEDYIPLSPGASNQVKVLFNSSGNVMKVDAMFEQAESGEILAFSQIPLDPAVDVPPFNFGTGQVEPEFVTINDTEAVWLQGFPWGSKPDESGDTVPVLYNLLIWEVTREDGSTFQFWLGSEELLSQDMMLRIAESVVP
jgi:hypothetical protein